MNIKTLNTNKEISAQNERDAWINFIKSGSVKDYLIYFRCKEISVISHQGENKNAYSSQWNSSGRNNSK